MHHIVTLLRRMGVEEAYPTLHYLADEVESYFGEGTDFGVAMHYSVEDVPLGTAGSVRRLRGELRGTFLIVSGDALTDFDLRGAVAFHRERGAKATLVLTRVADPLEFGVVITNGEGRVVRFLEKPNPGEVFSDTVNTGIYILEPEVLERVDTSRPFDFSKDLFPALLADGQLVCGYVAEGYWTDIGNLRQYQEANRDCLLGKVAVEMPGEELQPGVWVGEDLQLHPSAELAAPSVIGHGCSIGAGAKVGPFSVVGENSVIEAGAVVDHSVVWGGAYIGRGSRVIGATLCRNVRVKGSVTVNEGAVVGDRCLLDDGTVVMPNIRMWPEKATGRGARVTMSLIWGTKWPGTLFGATGVSGLSNVEITPEYAARLGAAFGAYLEGGAHVITSRDSHLVSRMVKRAVIAGLMSVGANVMDLRIMPSAVPRHLAHISGASGGVHVSVSPSDASHTLIEFFDGSGRNVDRVAERKIEQIFFREDFRRAPIEAVGGLEFMGRTMEYYTEDFLNFVDAEAIRRWGPRVVVDYAYGPLCVLMPLVMGRLGCESTALNAFIDPTRAHQAWLERKERLGALREVLKALHAEVGLLVEAHGDRFAAVDEKGLPVVGDDLLLTYMDLVLQQAGVGMGAGQGVRPKVAVTFDASSGAEEVCARWGAECVRTKADARSLMEAAGADAELVFAGDTAGGFIFPRFLPAFDAMVSVGKLLELLANTGQRLGEVRARTPRYFRASREVGCPWEHKGTVMRRLHEERERLPSEQLDGIKVLLEGAWVLVRPDVSLPLFHVRAESRCEGRAEALVAEYAAKVERMQEGL
jgi:mannose-1-phosphate guanylyltransferase/phosphomannomutase